jgi:hypothetical protein
VRLSIRLAPLWAISFVLVAGCASSSSGPRLRWVSSQATQASWSLVVDDRARGGALWIDGRPREDNCDRVRSQIRCELRGLWPGGHSFELRVAGAVLKRTVLIGHSWPERLAIVRVRSPDDAEAAAKAGADAVLVSGGETRSIVAAAHAHSMRALVWWDASAIEWAGADGIVTGAIPPELAVRFPEARVFLPPPEPTDAAATALALVEGNVVVPPGAFALLRERKHDKLLARGRITPSAEDAPPEHRAFAIGGLRTLFVNLGQQPWRDVPAREWRISGNAPEEGEKGIVNY